MTASLTGLVLAGGQGSRMEGADKGLMLFRGMPMFLHALERIRPHVAKVLLSANRNATVYAGFGCDTVPDLTDTYPGPLAGLQAALKRCETELLVMVPCDVPLFPPDLVPALYASMQSGSADLAVAVAEGERQAVFLMLKCSLRSELDLYLQTNRRSVLGFIDHCIAQGYRLAEVAFSDQGHAFANINTLAELNALDPDS